MLRLCVVALIIALAAPLPARVRRAAEQPDLIFKRSTVFKLLTRTTARHYGLDDPEVEGVACHFTCRSGRLVGWIGVAEEVSDISLACGRSARSISASSAGEDVFSASAARCSSRRCRSCAARPQAQCARLHGLFDA